MLSNVSIVVKFSTLHKKMSFATRPKYTTEQGWINNYEKKVFLLSLKCSVSLCFR